MQRLLHDHHLVEPVDPDPLRNLLASLPEKRRQT
jgi:hypothetical protein